MPIARMDAPAITAVPAPHVARWRSPSNPRQPRRAHLIGIAGSGMRSLARVLAESGWEVTGSDTDIAAVAQLVAGGNRVRSAHAAQNIPPGTELVVYSDAIPSDNSERRRAAEMGISQCSYPAMLARLMRGRHGVAIAGTHGKSTTAAMTGAILERAGLDPTFVYGAESIDGAPGARHGRGELALVEACEYQRNFLKLRPRTAVVLGVEPDHFDTYHSEPELLEAFRRFAKMLPHDGLLLANSDCPRTRAATRPVASRRRTFGLLPGTDWRAISLDSQGGLYRFRILREQRFYAEIRLAVSGVHNVRNALAAAALSAELGAAARHVAQALGDFRGLRRRLEPLYTSGSVAVLDDYAHHPTAVEATLAAAREMYPNRPLKCVFQPHQIMRTRHLLDELARSLQNTDGVVVMPVYVAREESTAARRRLAERLELKIRQLGTSAETLNSESDAIAHLWRTTSAGDVVITIGAGDIRNVGDGFVDGLRRNRAA